MGYSTEFGGSLSLSSPVKPELKAFLDDLAGTRRMQRDPQKLMEIYKGEHGWPFAIDKTNPEEVYGYKGEYFIEDFQGDGTIINGNLPSGMIAYGEWEKGGKLKQPSLHLQWVLNDAGDELEWDGEEGFEEYVEWLEYLIEHFFQPFGIKLNGEIVWYGDDPDDRGKIVVIDNVVKIYDAVIDYEERDEDDEDDEDWDDEDEDDEDDED